MLQQVELEARNLSRIPEVVIYGKEGCCLCSEALEILFKVQQEMPFTLVQTDITTDDQLMEKYQYSIPVICINGIEKFIYEVDEEALKSSLAGKKSRVHVGT